MVQTAERKIEGGSMNNCKDLDELKKLGLDGLYKLVQDQQEQIDRMFGALDKMLTYIFGKEFTKEFLYGKGENND